MPPRALTVDACRGLNPPVYPVEEYRDPNPDWNPKKAVHLLDFDVSKAKRVLILTTTRSDIFQKGNNYARRLATHGYRMFFSFCFLI